MASDENFSAKLAGKAAEFTMKLLRVAAGTRKDILKELNALENDLVDELNRAVGRGELTAGALRSLLAQTRDVVNSAYDDIATAHAKELKALVKVSLQRVSDAINETLHIPLLAVKTPADAVKQIALKTLINGAQSREWWAGQAASLRQRFAVSMRMGLYQGESVAELARRIRGTKAAGFSDGLMQLTRSQAETLVRTSALAVANTARLEAIMQNSDLVKGVQWVSTLDSRTTEICIALDGLQWKLPSDGDPENYGGYKPIGHDKRFPGPTAHWNCRSTQIPILLSFDELQGEGGWDFGGEDDAAFNKIFLRKLEAKGFSASEARKILADTRASMDGQSADVKSFDDWLGEKSNSFQDELIGKSQAALWREGKITLTDLTDQKNRPISVEDL